MIVKPETWIGWHPQGFKLFWKSRAGRVRLPENIRKLIVRMAQENGDRLGWSEARNLCFSTYRARLEIEEAPEEPLRSGRRLSAIPLTPSSPVTFGSW